MRRHTADMQQPAFPRCSALCALACESAVILCFNAPRYMAGDPRFR